MDTLREVVFYNNCTYIVADALDECTERAQLLTLIQQMFNWKIDTLHLMMASRREKQIEDTLSGFAQTVFSFESVLVNDDIMFHIQKQMEEEPSFRRLPAKDKLKIEKTLAEKANGMFRWAVCQMDTLKRCRNVKSLPTTLWKHFPKIWIPRMSGYFSVFPTMTTRTL
ncbi:hypothetical protein AJ79_03118 [Helicocarpus griseus UAMH5409]|uniref:Nephrocystin 3-like N-terminal domain-containing protein n=1 Tax=Helicocarpus griseus UAMH5409 TaxID=1447875 RepID=A0A2B7XYL3_9EURO|nr:hypothetical protein AJ79_03118 [Helicocarpus griseus UAMH5409]